MMIRLRKKWKIWKRKLRKQHPFPWQAHVLWWVLFGCMDAFYFYFLVHTKEWKVVLCFVMVQALFFYVAYLFILKPPLRLNRYLWVFGLKCVGWMVLETVCFMVILIVVSILRGKIHLDTDFSKPFHFHVWNIPHFVFAFVALGMVHSALFFYLEREKLARMNAARMDQLMRELHNKWLMLEMDWSIGQMDPHFLGQLFTALRAKIRTATSRQMLRAMNYLINLTDFYLVYARHIVPIWLKHELRELRCMLAMERIANDKMAQRIKYVLLNFPKVIPKVKIVPMLLLVLMENILGHASAIDKRHPAMLSVQEREGMLHIHTENYFDPQIKKVNQWNHHGVALKSMKNRVFSVYPGAVFTNQQEGECYVVDVYLPVC